MWDFGSAAQHLLRFAPEAVAVRFAVEAAVNASCDLVERRLRVLVRESAQRARVPVPDGHVETVRLLRHSQRLGLKRTPQRLQR